MDNTNRMNPMGQPGAALRRAGLARMGLTPANPADDWNLQNIATAFNSEILFFENLNRARQGLPPLQPGTYAPSVNVGLEAGTQQTLLIAGAVALAAVLLLKKR